MKKYLITSREFCHEQLKEYLPEYALYRDKSNPDYTIQASHFVETCNQFENIKSFLHQNIDLAQKLGSTGVHLTSKQIELIPDAKSKNLEVIVSTHTKAEVLKAQELGADAVTYSPIFASPNKGEPKGVGDLKNLLVETEIKVFALGGVIDLEQIEILKDTGVYGFASIRYFEN
ncbi:MAG: thiamine phosphate synthase [Campylobacterota bacterium]|nr:thiamine phosphate synthase [Campylobacterota bacterium]